MEKLRIRLPELASTRRAAPLNASSLVETQVGGNGLPVVVTARAAGVPLPRWSEANRAAIDDMLHSAGAVLFRGFEVGGLSQFREVAASVSTKLVEYEERSSPRTELTSGVYTSTDHPPDQRIVMHNEQSYTLHWPMRLMFYSIVVARKGGNTPIADSRRILARLPAEIVEKFSALGVRYVRNYNSGLGLTWQSVFGTERRAEVEAYCKANDICFQWPGGDRLRTWQVRPAIRRHPVSGARVWFNHAMFFNVASLAPAVAEAMLAAVGEDRLPTQTAYGDGSAIPAQVIHTLRDAYDDASITFDWREGDVLIIDNMLTSHGRQPFEGPRKLACAMTDPINVVADIATTEDRP